MESVSQAYRELCSQWTEVIQLNENLRTKVNVISKEKEVLASTVASLQRSLQSEKTQQAKLLSEFNALKRNIRMLNSGTSNLDDILCLGKDAGNHHGIGYDARQPGSTTTFVKGSKKPEEADVTEYAETPPVTRRNRRRRVCHYCLKPGHIRPWCYRLQKDLKKQSQSQKKTVAPPERIWRVREPDIRCNVAYTSLRAMTTEDWYFDSGCSRHMTGQKGLLKNIETCPSRHVTFGDGVKGKILGVGTLNVDGLPPLDKVLYVQDLKANLISVSQLYDAELYVHFNKTSCPMPPTIML